MGIVRESIHVFSNAFKTNEYKQGKTLKSIRVGSIYIEKWTYTVEGNIGKAMEETLLFFKKMVENQQPNTIWSNYLMGRIGCIAKKKKEEMLGKKEWMERKRKLKAIIEDHCTTAKFHSMLPVGLQWNFNDKIPHYYG